MSEGHPAGASTFRSGHWLPTDLDVLKAWLHEFKIKAQAREGPRNPAVQAFAELIESDPVARMYAKRMIGEVPKTQRYRARHLESVEEMLGLIDAVIGYAPEYHDDAYVGCPLDAIFDWSMGTLAGFAFFRLPAVNAALKAIMDAWRGYLTSEASLHVLNASAKGWKCKRAQARVGISDFAYDPKDPHWGFTSWNDFFTRRLREGARPVASPTDGKVIVSPCEATPYRIATEVKRLDDFWIKGQPYSLHDMLAGDASVDTFVGGVVWQAFLSAFNYHRWHSPVTGTVAKTQLVAGTYFSESESEGEDPVGPNNSQPYLAHVAARAIIHIDADDPAVGRLVVMPIGMGEISSCVISVEPGVRVSKGDELGYFQYGGSTLCCLFRPGAVSAFALDALPQPGHAHAPPLRVNAFLARAAD